MHLSRMVHCITQMEKLRGQDLHLRSADYESTGLAASPPRVTTLAGGREEVKLLLLVGVASSHRFSGAIGRHAQ